MVHTTARAILMIEYEIHRAGYGKNYTRNDCIMLSLQSVMRDCNHREVDWQAFGKHLRYTLDVAKSSGQTTVVMYLSFETETDAIYFKMQHGDNLNSKLLPDQHLHPKNIVKHSIEAVDVLTGDGQD